MSLAQQAKEEIKDGAKAQVQGQRKRLQPPKPAGAAARRRRGGHAGAATETAGAVKGKRKISAKANLGHGLNSVQKITALTPHPPKKKFRPETCRNLNHSDS